MLARYIIMWEKHWISSISKYCYNINFIVFIPDHLHFLCTIFSIPSILLYALKNPRKRIRCVLQPNHVWQIKPANIFSMSYISIWPGTFAKKEVIYETAEYNNFFQKTSWRQLDSLFITIFNNKLLLIRN